MSTIASNLGQILGRLMCEQLERRRQRTSTYRARPVKQDGVGVAGTIRHVLRTLPPGEDLSTLEIAALTEGRLTVVQVQTNIPYMPDVERVGDRRPHGYRLVER